MYSAGPFSYPLVQVNLNVVPAQEFAGRVNTQARIREEIMPARLERRIGLLSNQCIRQPNSRTTFAHQILPEIVFYLPCLMAQQGQKSHRQRHQSVFSSFTANHPNLPETDILDTQAHSLNSSQFRAVQHRDQAQKGSDPFFHTLNGQEGQEADDVFIVQLARVALAAVQNEVLDPVKICADRPATVALDQHEVLNRLEKRRFRHVPHLIHEMYADRYTRCVT